jgi:hypothetical protein
MIKHGSSDRSAADGKRQRKSITLEEKLDVIKKCEYNEHTVGIGNAMGIPKLAITLLGVPSWT